MNSFPPEKYNLLLEELISDSSYIDHLLSSLLDRLAE